MNKVMPRQDVAEGQQANLSKLLLREMEEPEDALQLWWRCQA